MADEDLRALLDPLLAVKAARPIARTVEAPGGGQQLVAAVDTDQMPDVALVPTVEGDVGIDLAAQLALVQSALGRLADLQLRGVHGQRTFTSALILQAGDTRDITIPWSTTPLAPCRHATARLDLGVAWLGKLSASVPPESVTDTGATVRLTASATVVVNSGQPLTVHADGAYFYWPPYGQETT